MNKEATLHSEKSSLFKSLRAATSSCVISSKSQRRQAPTSQLGNAALLQRRRAVTYGKGLGTAQEFILVGPSLDLFYQTQTLPTRSRGMTHSR